MKKVIKSKVFLCIIVGICCIGIGVYGANNYNAKEILYNPSSGNSMTVNEALNELYNNTISIEKPIQNMYFYDAGGSAANGYVIYNTNGCTTLKINSIGLKNSQAYDWTHFYVYGINGDVETKIYYVHSSVITLKIYENIILDISEYEKIKISYSVFGSYINVNSLFNLENDRVEIPELYFYDAGGSAADGYISYDVKNYSKLKIASIKLKNSQAYDWTHFYVYGINGDVETKIYYVHSSVTSLLTYEDVELDISSYERIKISYSVFGSYVETSNLIIS